MEASASTPAQTMPSTRGVLAGALATAAPAVAAAIPVQGSNAPRGAPRAAGAATLTAPGKVCSGDDVVVAWAGVADAGQVFSLII